MLQSERSFERLCREFTPRLVRSCIRIIGDRDLAEDITQETLLRAWERRDTFDEDRDLGPWLHTVARNLCIEALRTRARTVAMAAVPEQPIDEDLGAHLEDADDLVLLRKALADLPERQREMILLQEVARVGYAELAKHLGTTEPTARVMLFRARRNLRERFAAAAGAIAMLGTWIRAGVMDRARKVNQWFQTASSANVAFVNAAVGLVVVSAMGTPASSVTMRSPGSAPVASHARVTDVVRDPAGRPTHGRAASDAVVRAASLSVDPHHGADVDAPVPSSDGGEGRARARLWRDRESSRSVLLTTLDDGCERGCPAFVVGER